ncbi:Lrp/AsnC family transcriptional regulator [Salinisphaera sp. Q1T1-3]|uniref:Lrp/AsnC family transcriptional regulator n=1 Tax=Salinisphaera sp. Q1T1-3 TaxID=2321229 RepID=UPI000E70C99A|nr:Lrp/AsnC family transcriptional regulator [Salinisphaera sp. Q1T1-3]RJS91842.1 Lrp/AsnC family transcriptional regulator [Salinisphaera sp. Q1T1-3]
MDMAVKLDRIDIDILATLQANGRMSNVDLSQAVHLSPSPCLQRVKRLQAAKYITSYQARIDLTKIADSVTVFAEVTLGEHRCEHHRAFEQYLETVDGLLECHMISGGYDYLLRFVSRSIGHFQQTMESLLDDAKVDIDRFDSYIVIKSPIVKDQVPIKTLLAS